LKQLLQFWAQLTSACRLFVIAFLNRPLFFQFSKKFLPIKVVIWVCMNCLDCLDLAGLCIFFSWWRNPSLWIEVVIGILGTSYSCRLGTWLIFDSRSESVCTEHFFVSRMLIAMTECFSKNWLGLAACVWFALSKWIYTASTHSFDCSFGSHFSSSQCSCPCVLSPVYKSTPTMTNITYVA